MIQQTIKEFIKLIISTFVFPFMILILIFITFIAAHEAFWKSLSRPTETE